MVSQGWLRAFYDRHDERILISSGVRQGSGSIEVTRRRTGAFVKARLFSIWRKTGRSPLIPIPIRQRIRNCKASCSSPILGPIIDEWAAIRLPDCWLVAGPIAQTVWNSAFGLPLDHGLRAFRDRQRKDQLCPYPTARFVTTALE